MWWLYVTVPSTLTLVYLDGISEIESAKQQVNCGIFWVDDWLDLAKHISKIFWLRMESRSKGSIFQA